MTKTIISLAIVTLLSGCASSSALREMITGNQFDEPTVEKSKFLQKEKNKMLPPAGGPIPVAVYSFQDKTGQRKSIPNIASLSSAVTQGAENYLIKALQDVGDGRWFTVLERVGLENLIKERQMIRQMREQYQGRDAKPLPPMVFAGIIIEGGIVGYDSNTITGGSGMRLFGIGASTQYQSDTVTVTLRTVSVSTGEILTTVTITKTVLSYMDKLTLLRFVGDGTAIGANATALEGEIGGSVNESINKAIDVAVQAAVVNTIQEGSRKGIWAYRQEIAIVPEPVKLIEVKEPPKEVPKQIVEPPKEVPKEIVEPPKEPPKPKEEPKVEIKPAAVVPPPPEVPKTVVGKKMTLIESTYVRKNPTLDTTGYKTLVWLFNKNEEVVIISQTDSDWVEVKNNMGRKGFIKLEKLKEMN
jgi:curli production assembly/transport component CsgG